MVSDIVQCWSAAKNLIEAENELKANAAASSSDIPLPPPKRTYQAMAAAYVEANGKISDREAPGKPLMAMTLSMVQDNDPVAEPLTHIASKAEGEDDVTFDETDYSGSIRGVHRKVKIVPLPKDPEELRMRYTIIENALLYAQFKHSNRTWLADFKPYGMKKVADYILGDKCWKLEALQEQGKQVPWHIVLKYEFAVRKKGHGVRKGPGLGFTSGAG